MRRVRVLHINKFYHPWLGGVEKSVQDVAEGLQRTGDIDVEILACQPGGKFTQQVINEVRVTRAGSLGVLLGMPVSFSLPFVIHRMSKRFDIMHFHFPFPLVLLNYLDTRRGEPKIVVHYHSDIVRRSQKLIASFFHPLLHNFLTQADRIIVTSTNLLAHSTALGPFQDKCRVVPLPINLSMYPPVARSTIEATRAHLGLRDEEKVVLFVGRLVYYKGVQFLVEAMHAVCARLLIAGEGPLAAGLRRQTAEMRLEHKVVFLGRVSDDQLRVLFALADVFVLPSVEPSEAFGLVQLEALAYGKPVVNTSLATGVPLVSRNGETGLTVAPRDAQGLARAISLILDDPILAARFSAAARERVQYFSVENVVRQIRSLYLEIL